MPGHHSWRLGIRLLFAILQGLWTACRMLRISEQSDLLLPSRVELVPSSGPIALCYLTPLRMSMTDMPSYGDGTRSGMFESFSTLNTWAICCHPFSDIYVGVEAFALRSVAASRISVRYICSYSYYTLVSCFICFSSGFVFLSLTRLIFCERFLFTLGKPFDSCVLPGLIISGGGMRLVIYLLDFIIENVEGDHPELLDRCVSGITDIKWCSEVCDVFTQDTMSAFCS